jgi:hypothetical protein
MTAITARSSGIGSCLRFRDEETSMNLSMKTSVVETIITTLPLHLRIKENYDRKQHPAKPSLPTWGVVV